MKYYVIKNTKDNSYWGYPDGKATFDGQPTGWTKDYDQMHLYESTTKMRYAKADVVAQCTDVKVSDIIHTEVYL